jgi:hypothetical protein
MSMKITDWAVEDRPRERLWNKGPSSLSDAELLAILIGSGTRNNSALDLARELLAWPATHSVSWEDSAPARYGKSKGWVKPRRSPSLQPSNWAGDEKWLKPLIIRRYAHQPTCSALSAP